MHFSPTPLIPGVSLDPPGLDSGIFRVPWTARSNQSILKEINPEYSLERDAEAEAPVLWPPDATSQLTEKYPEAEKD